MSCARATSRNAHEIFPAAAGRQEARHATYLHHPPPSPGPLRGFRHFDRSDLPRNLVADLQGKLSPPAPRSSRVSRKRRCPVLSSAPKNRSHPQATCAQPGDVSSPYRATHREGFPARASCVCHERYWTLVDEIAPYRLGAWASVLDVAGRLRTSLDGSPGRIRTSDQSVNSRTLYH
jgi:hypothetical protein